MMLKHTILFCITDLNYLKTKRCDYDFIARKIVRTDSIADGSRTAFFTKFRTEFGQNSDRIRTADRIQTDRIQTADKHRENLSGKTRQQIDTGQIREFDGRDYPRFVGICVNVRVRDLFKFE